MRLERLIPTLTRSIAVQEDVLRLECDHAFGPRDHRYSVVIRTSPLGWLVWADTPGFWTLVGASVIVVSGIFIVWRESRQAT